MKKYFSLAFLLVTCFSFTSAQTNTSCLTISNNLKVGVSKDSNTGGEVSKLQTFLGDSGYLTVSPTGNFGPATLVAVIAFQKAQGLSAYGYVGPKTRQVINTMSCGTSQAVGMTQNSALSVSQTATSVGTSSLLPVSTSSMVVGQVFTRTRSCPVGQKGSITETRTVTSITPRPYFDDQITFSPWVTVSGGCTQGPVPISFSGYEQPTKFVDSSDGGYAYGYGPSVIKVNNMYYMYYCSSGTGSLDWDHVRYATSSDGSVWSIAGTALRTSGANEERAACDPSIVRYDAGDGLYYYLFYSGNKYNVQTVNFVARSQSPEGPFLKLTNRDTWEYSARDPKIIFSPLHATPEGGSAYYGLGQPTVVVKDGVLYQWFTDTTSLYPTGEQTRLYLSTTTDVKNWSPRTDVNVIDSSVDIKYDSGTGYFYMFSLDNLNHAQNTRVVTRVSSDGITWEQAKEVVPVGGVPAYVNNIGVFGTETGGLIPDVTKVVYGAPYDLSYAYSNQCSSYLSQYCWGHWDLYGQKLNLVGSTVPAVCTPLPNQSQTLTCPAGQTGAITQTRVSSCGVGATEPTWGVWKSVTNTCATLPVSPVSNKTPIGVIDTASSGVVGSCGMIVGWAYDEDNSSASTEINLYLDGPAGVGTPFNAGDTTILRTSLNPLKGITGNHGYAYQIPNLTAGNHTVYVYSQGVNTAGVKVATEPVHLVNSPMSFTCSAPTQTPTGIWSYSAPCTTACGASQVTQIQICTGGNGSCSGQAGTRVCNATAMCPVSPTGIWSYSTPCTTACGASQVTQTQICTGGNGGCAGQAGTRVCNATAVCPVSPTPGISNKRPIGFVDAVFASAPASCGMVGGWAYDADNGSASTEINVYVDGLPGVGTGYNAGVTNALRPDVNAAYGITGNHGYNYQIPKLTAGTHTVYVYSHGVDIAGNKVATEPILLTGSPFSFYCPTGVAYNVQQIQTPAVLGAFTSNSICTDIPRNLIRGTESVYVTELQDFLFDRDFLTEVPTGFYGDKTVEAVKDYQASKSLPVTGMVYDFTRKAIKAESCK